MLPNVSFNFKAVVSIIRVCSTVSSLFLISQEIESAAGESLSKRVTLSPTTTELSDKIFISESLHSILALIDGPRPISSHVSSCELKDSSQVSAVYSKLITSEDVHSFTGVGMSSQSVPSSSLQVISTATLHSWGSVGKGLGGSDGDGLGGSDGDGLGGSDGDGLGGSDGDGLGGSDGDSLGVTVGGSVGGLVKTPTIVKTYSSSSKQGLSAGGSASARIVVVV